MLRIISQNIINYGIEIPDNTILRINLAWCSSVKQLRNILEGHKNNSIFIDLPIKRIKPPNNKYTLNDLISVISSYSQIKYFAISNVESASDLEDYIQNIPPNIITASTKIGQKSVMLKSADLNEKGASLGAKSGFFTVLIAI